MGEPAALTYAVNARATTTNAATVRRMARDDTDDADSESRCRMVLRSGGNRCRRRRVEIHRLRAIAKGIELDTNQVERREHRVGHRRAVRRLDVQVALQLAAGMTGEEQRAALVVVDVRVAHR